MYAYYRLGKKFFFFRSKEQNAVSNRHALEVQNKLALSEETFINNAALSSATSRNNVAV